MSNLTIDPAVRVQQLQIKEDGRQPAVRSDLGMNRNCAQQDVAHLVQKEVPAIELLEESVKQANETMKIYHTNLQFVIHEDSGEYIVKVINSENQEVIREIPPEKILDMVAYFKRLIGIIVDEIV